jgi:SAM-dependent methyltransferase
MKQLGWEVYGVDYSARAIAIARENGLEHLSHGGLADARFPDGTFDVINFTHVVEHIPDVGSVFDEARRILKPSGELIVSVPHFNGLYRRIFGAHADYDVPRHVYQFTLPGMRRLLEEHGFEISEYYVNDIMRGVAHAASFSLGANRKVTWCLLAPALLVDLAIEPFLCHTELGAQLIVKAKKKTAHAAA